MMIKNFTDIAFTEKVKEIQRKKGSRNNYLRMEQMEMNQLGQREKNFIEERETFYMSTVGKDGWPYVQHRGGPKGFLKVLSSNQIAFADFRGNMQYISTGNLLANNKVALILMDYPNRTRLKLWAETEIVSASDTKLEKLLTNENYPMKVESFILMNVKSYDWNCPQHIVPRFTLHEYSNLLDQGALKFDVEYVEKLLNNMKRLQDENA